MFCIYKGFCYLAICSRESYSIFMAIITMETLAELRKTHAEKRIVFCSGVFDLTHAGHALFFEDCKKLGDILVVAVGCDMNIQTYKGKGRPVCNQYVRAKMVDSLKPIDYVFIDEPMQKENLHEFLPHVFAKLQPDVYAVNKDAFGIPDRQKILERYPQVQFVLLERWCPPEFDAISTTGLIQKIKEV